ncbi:MAG: hypothetical protein WBS17_11955 [Candidatus Acidiferrales bacterium]
MFLLSLFLGVFSVACLSAMAQNSRNSPEIKNLKLIVDQQQKAREQLQAQIQVLQFALADQKKMLASLVLGAPSSDAANDALTGKRVLKRTSGTIRYANARIQRYYLGIWRDSSAQPPHFRAPTIEAHRAEKAR